jgi:hypothetical protein
MVIRLASFSSHINTSLVLLLIIGLVPAVRVSPQPLPICPQGSAPEEIMEQTRWANEPPSPPLYHWECKQGSFWPEGYHLDESDCPQGTQYFGSIRGEPSKCLPPAPKCDAKSAPFPDTHAASGWTCYRHQDCPPGTEASLSPVQGWFCDTLDRRVECPSGTKFRGVGGGGCVPADEQTCRNLRGWQWHPVSAERDKQDAPGICELKMWERGSVVSPGSAGTQR